MSGFLTIGDPFYNRFDYYAANEFQLCKVTKIENINGETVYHDEHNDVWVTHEEMIIQQELKGFINHCESHSLCPECKSGDINESNRTFSLNFQFGKVTAFEVKKRLSNLILLTKCNACDAVWDDIQENVNMVHLAH